MQKKVQESSISSQNKRDGEKQYIKR